MSSYRTGGRLLTGFPPGWLRGPGQLLPPRSWFCRQHGGCEHGVACPNLLSPCVFSEKHVLGWRVLLRSFEQDRALMEQVKSGQEDALLFPF